MDSRIALYTTEGEASESDEELIVPGANGECSAMRRQAVTPMTVEGEASESDEEEIDMSDLYEKRPSSLSESVESSVSSGSYQSEARSDLCVKVFRNRGIPLIYNTKSVLRHDTLLHRKLHEKNLALRRTIEDMMLNVFDTSSISVVQQTQQLKKSQIILQNVAHTCRNAVDEFRVLKGKIAVLTSWAPALPNITIPQALSQSSFM